MSTRAERSETHDLPREFAPGIEKFCADPKDFVNQNQIIQIATFFGFQRIELKKIRLMASGEENRAAATY